MTKPKPKDQLQKRGRKSLFREEFILIAKAAARFGATEDEIADELKISDTTLDNWKKTRPEFLGALKASKAAADDRVERSLYARATGYSYDAVKIFHTKDGKITKVPYTEHVPPDVTAQIYWLKNRRPDRWRDVQNIDHAVGVYHISETPLSEEEWIREHCSNGKQLEHEASPALPKTE
jgi:hypothetical protein